MIVSKAFASAVAGLFIYHDQDASDGDITEESFTKRAGTWLDIAHKPAGILKGTGSHEAPRLN